MKTGAIKMTLFLALSALARTAAAQENPFFTAYNTPWDVPPFDKIKVEHFMPAYEKGIAEQRAEVAVITSSTEAPTFKNTICLSAILRASSWACGISIKHRPQLVSQKVR